MNMVMSFTMRTRKVQKHVGLGLYSHAKKIMSLLLIFVQVFFIQKLQTLYIIQKYIIMETCIKQLQIFILWAIPVFKRNGLVLTVLLVQDVQHRKKKQKNQTLLAKDFQWIGVYNDLKSMAIIFNELLLFLYIIIF